jgi:hypothetical protein
MQRYSRKSGFDPGENPRKFPEKISQKFRKFLSGFSQILWKNSEKMPKNRTLLKPRNLLTLKRRKWLAVKFIEILLKKNPIFF